MMCWADKFGLDWAVLKLDWSMVKIDDQLSKVSPVGIYSRIGDVFA